MEPDFSTQLQAEGLSIAVETLTKEKPIVQYQADGTADVYFPSDSIPRLQKQLADFMAKKSMVRVHAEPVVVPVMLKKFWPVIAGIAAAGFLVALLTVKRR